VAALEGRAVQATTADGSRPVHLVAVSAGENPSFDYFLRPRLGRESTIIDLANGPSALPDRPPEELALVFCRYVPPLWLAWTLRHAKRLGGLGIFLDDDYGGLVLDRTVPLRYRWKVMRLGLLPWRALSGRFTHVWTGSDALAKRLRHPKAVALEPIAPAEDLGGLPATGGRPEADGSGEAMRLAFHATAVHRREHLWLAALADRLKAAVPGARLEVVADRRLAPIWREHPWVEVRPSRPWPAYRDAARRGGADLFLVPLVDARINEGRSFSKVIDAVRLGAVPLLADALAYRPLAGLLPLIPPDPQAWIEAVVRYGLDADLRARTVAALRSRLEADRAAVGPLL
jgi:hypothetical protein